jgi:serine/threonine-protein kinase RsbW
MGAWVVELGEGTAGENGGGRAIRLTIPARAEFITLGRLALTGLSRLRELPEETVADLKLALTEACSNSVRHAYPGGGGHVEIVYELLPDRLAIEISDDGEGFEPHEAEPSEPEELTEGGLGIAIIRSIADELDIGAGTGGRGSRLRFVKLLA